MSDSIHVLWTGGWDSTYRVLYASLVEKKIVFPHYIADLGRPSTIREIRAISDVRRELEKIDLEAAQRIQELRITPVTEIKADNDITGCYERLKSRAKLGSQYDWLARYAKQNNLDALELSVHVDDRAYYFLQGKVIEKADGGWKFDPSISDDTRMFARFEFPLLEISKTQMRENATSLGMIKALEKSWFCHKPSGNKACGLCAPCGFAVDEGMSYRLPLSAKVRYRFRHVYSFIKLPFRAARKIKNVVLN